LTQASDDESKGGLPGYLEMSLGDFLTALGSGQAAPGGGSAAAACVALGACLCAMTARLSVRQLAAAQASDLAAEADRLSQAAASLIQADAESFQRAWTARRRPAAEPASQQTQAAAGEQLNAADLSAAAAVPLQIMELASQVARLAARLAKAGNRNLHGDAVTGLMLAEAGARAAAVLVEINLGGADDERAKHVTLLLDAIAGTVREAIQK